MLRQFLVEIKLPSQFTEEMIERIPAQRNHISQLMDMGTVLTYSLSEDRSKLWTVMLLHSEEEVMETLAQFPMIKFMNPDIHELAFHNQASLITPVVSLN